VEMLRLRLLEDAALPRYQNIKEQESHCILELALRLELELCPVFSVSAYAVQFATPGEGNNSFSFVLLFFISWALHQAVAADELHFSCLTNSFFRLGSTTDRSLRGAYYRVTA
jgi:hypothetical protein